MFALVGAFTVLGLRGQCRRNTERVMEKHIKLDNISATDMEPKVVHYLAHNPLENHLFTFCILSDRIVSTRAFATATWRF